MHLQTGVLHDWYGMEKRKLDAETRQDLAMIQYRDFVPSADGRHRIAKYKKRALPQYFEVRAYRVPLIFTDEEVEASRHNT